MGIMKQSTTSSSSAGIAVDSKESTAIDVVNDVVAEDITLYLDSVELHYLCENNHPINLSDPIIFR
jgi:hypothetical protein